MGTGGGEGNQTIDGRELWELSLSDLHKTLRTSALNGGGLGLISVIRCGSFSAAWCVCVEMGPGAACVGWHKAQ